MKLLFVDDEATLRDVVERQMAKEGIDVVCVGSGEEALEQLASGDFDVAVTDLRLPGIDGIEIIRKTRESGDDIPFLLITAYASVKTAVAALQAGAADFLIKPVRMPDLLHRVGQLFDHDRLKRENVLLRRMAGRESESTWLPDTPAGQKINDLLAKVAHTDMTVTIVGETGTGKGIVARLLHDIGPRAKAPFLSVNCGAIPETLIESELFGHIKGAFTGADRNQPGLFMGAAGGTLFLDEIGEVSPAMQAKLLHAIEDKNIRPIGDNRDRAVDVRIVTATNRDLEQLVADGTFRRDLYYRLNMFEIELPPLRELKDSLRAAVDFFLTKHRRRRGLPEVTIDDGVWRHFQAYDWPGNLRELDNVIERALLLCEDGRITLSELPPALTGKGGGQPEAAVTGPLKDRVQSFERAVITREIENAGGDRRAAARVLGIGLSTLYRKLEEAEPEPGAET